jgi:hypothetical protein
MSCDSMNDQTGVIQMFREDLPNCVYDKELVSSQLHCLPDLFSAASLGCKSSAKVIALESRVSPGAANPKREGGRSNPIAIGTTLAIQNAPVSFDFLVNPRWLS